MGRKVSVSLSLDILGFVRPAETAKKAVDDLGDKVDKLDRDLDKIPPDAAKAAAAMKLLGTEADLAGKKVGEIGDKRTQLAALDSKIRESRGEVRKLADEFRNTGNVDVFKKLGDAQGRLSALTKIRKELADDIEEGLREGFTNPGSWPGFAEAAQQAALAFAAPFGGALLAAAGGALAGGAGMGVAGLGLAGAVMGDPERFKGAWGAAVRDVKDEFFHDTEGFTEDVYAGIARIGPLVKSWNLKQVFADAEKYATPLFQGIEGLSTGLVKGVGALVAKGQPAVDALSDSMIMLGEASQSALTSIADGASGGASALHDLAAGVALVVEGFGKLVEGAEKAYGYIHDHPLEAAIGTGGMSIPLSLYQEATASSGRLGDTQEGLRQKAIAAGQAFNEQGDNLTALSQKMNAASLTTDKLAGAMENKLFTSLMNIDQATLGVAEAHTRLQETLDESHKMLGKHANMLDINTKRGQANEEAILAAVSANQQLFQAQVAAGMSAEDAAHQYDANTAALEKQMKDAGLTQQQIDGLIGKYKDIPDVVNTQIAIQGLTTAINDLDHTLRLMAGIKDKDVYVTVHTVFDDKTGQRKSGSSRLGGQEQYGGIRRAAEGMIVPPSDPGTVLFGEPATGGEAYIPLRGISQMRAMSLAQTVGNSYGFSVSADHGSAAGISITLVGGDDLTRAMLSQIRYEVRTGFGGNVQVALGR